MSSTTNQQEATRRISLPEGWRWVRLGEVCAQDRALIEARSQEAKEKVCVGLEHIESNTGQILSHPPGSTGNDVHGITFAFDSRHVLYGKLRPYLNKVALPDFSGRCTTELVPLLPKENLDRLFLAWLLRRPETVTAAMREKTGSRMPRANMKELMKMIIPLPSLPEQHRIGTTLTEAMGVVEGARAAAEAQLEGAKALPGAYLYAVFCGPEVEKWPKIRMGEVGEIVSGVTLGRKIEGEKTCKVPYLRVANVKDGRLELSGVYQIDATEDEIEKLTLRWGDLLLTEGGDPDKLGRGTFWTGQIEQCIHQNHIFRVRFDLERFSPEFISFQISSPYGKAYFLSHAKQTTGIATINQKVLSNFPLILPTHAKQKEIAAMLEQQVTASERTRKVLEEQLDSINAIPAALLRKAFSGEL